MRVIIVPCLLYCCICTPCVEVFYNPCPAYAAPSGPPRQVRVRPVDTREMHVSWMVSIVLIYLKISNINYDFWNSHCCYLKHFI